MIIHATAASGISTEDFKMALKEIFSSSNLLHRDDLFLEEDFSSCIARREGWIPDGKVGFYGTYSITSSSFSANDKRIKRSGGTV